MRVTPVLAEDYFRKEMYKFNRPHTDGKLSILIDCFVMLNQHEHLGNVETEGEDILKDNATLINQEK